MAFENWILAVMILFVCQAEQCRNMGNLEDLMSMTPASMRLGAIASPPCLGK